MKTIRALIERNCKLFFRDKGMFFSALITPLILIVLYGTFLANVYRSSFRDSLPDVVTLSDKLINGVVAGQLVAALLAVSCVTVTFCVNLIMVQDRTSGARKDFNVTPVGKKTIYLGYLTATICNSLLINLSALVVGLIYVRAMGWYLNASDVLFLLLDVVILVVFGCVLSGVICYPLRTQGQMSAVGTIVSAGYGFICGAYMPVSNFGDGLQKALSFLPGTYGTSMVKNHMLRGVFAELEQSGIPADVVSSMRDSLDCNPQFFGNTVSVGAMIAVMVISIAVFGAVYLVLASLPDKR